MSRLYDIARTALDLLITDWPADASIASPLPERAYVGNGFVIWDCEQVVVAVERTFGIAGDVAAEQFVSNTPIIAIRALTLAIWVIRCTPDIDVEGNKPVLPSPEDLEDSGAEILADSEQVLTILAKRQRLHEFAGCESLAFENWTSEGPEGGFGGGVTRVRIGLV